MTEEILLYEVCEGDTIRTDVDFRVVKEIEPSDIDMGECGDPECCGVADYYDVRFTDGTYFWGHGNTPVDKLV
jgi:hypothetical protein